MLGKAAGRRPISSSQPWLSTGCGSAAQRLPHEISGVRRDRSPPNRRCIDHARISPRINSSSRNIPGKRNAQGADTTRAIIGHSDKGKTADSQKRSRRQASLARCSIGEPSSQL
jgi:hypothetical protein